MNDNVKPGDSDTPSADATKNADVQDLNSVLASWDKPEDSKTDDVKPAAAPVVTQSFGDAEYAVDKTVSRVKGDLDLPDDVVRQYLKGLADENKGFDNAFAERGENPEKWEAVLNSVAENYQKVMSHKKVSADQVAADINDKGLAAAVLTARTSAGSGDTDAIDWPALSDSEFEVKKQEIFRLAEQGKLK